MAGQIATAKVVM